MREAEEGTACHDERKDTESNVHDVMDDEDRYKSTIQTHIIKEECGVGFYLPAKLTEAIKKATQA